MVFTLGLRHTARLLFMPRWGGKISCSSNRPQMEWRCRKNLPLCGPTRLNTDWLTERCDSLSAFDIGMREVAETELSDDNKRKLVANSERREQWDVEKWQPFITDLLPEDEVWRFQSPPTTWAKMCGCAGYCVVRNGRILRSLVTIRN